MNCKRTILRTAMSGIAFCLASSAWACDQYDSVIAAVQGDDIESAARLYEEIIVSASCDDALREWVGDFLARETFLSAMQDNVSPAEREAMLKRALGYERHWRTFNELGLLAWENDAYAEAAKNFQLALNELTEGDQSHEAASEEIATLYDYAWQSLALADEPADIPVTRSGVPGGIFTGKVRGFEVVEVPVPITFKFDSTEFDEAGLHFAETLVEYIMLVEPSEISLTGHTDPRGTDDYNDGLSLARAEAVAELLQARGFKGRIDVKGFGEREVPPAPPGIEENSEEHYRIARRVAFKAR